MIALIQLATKQLLRHRLRTALTVCGVASGMFLFTAVETLQKSLALATEETAADTTLVVYRENRYCPMASQLPEYYQDEIREMKGVKEVIPIKITVNNCGASLDVITFRGVPEGMLRQFAPEIEIIDGDESEWLKRGDAALLGEQFAKRRGLKPGDKFDAVGITVHVAGIIHSPFPQDNNVAYVKLNFLQQASKTGLGIVTQFNVRVDKSSDLKPVAEAIDARFKSDQMPTNTRPEKAFFAEAAGQLIELIGFTRWLGIAAVVAVVTLVANAISLMVRSRVKENAVLRTLGYPSRAIMFLVLSEGGLLGLMGGLGGAGFAWVCLRWQSFTMGSEGQTLAILPQFSTVLFAITAALALGIIASLHPAYIAIRQPIVKSLRS
jgi:putative ABC transport system permease protein